MKIFQDIFSQNEIISDSYPMTELYDGVIYEVKSNMLIKEEDKVDIGCGNAFGETEPEQVIEVSLIPKVNNILDSFSSYKLDDGMTPDLYKKHIKDYMIKIVAHLTAKKPERVEAFKKGVRQFVTWVMKNFDEFTFYSIQFDFQNMVVLSYFKDPSDQAPYFLYFVDGLKFYKA